MNNLTLSDLYNPDRITAVLLTNGDYIPAYENQGFQSYKKRIELWEQLPDGRLVKVRGWTTTVLVTYKEL